MSGYVLNYLITAETKAAHKARWFVYVGEPGTDSYQKIRYQSTMRGTWGYDVVCSCGWKSNTGGGVRSYVEELLFDHRYSAQCAKDREEEN